MGYKILLIDDDKQLLRMLRSYFELKGYIIVTAEDGMDAMENPVPSSDTVIASSLPVREMLIPILCFANRRV